jgi:putative membrane protein
MLAREAILAYAHFLSIFALASVIAAEVILFRQVMASEIFRRLRTIDTWYGILAGVVVITGLCRLWFGIKGPQYYQYNPIFWTKMALFVAVGLISIVPTVAYIRWGRAHAGDGPLELSVPEFGRIRGLLWLEVGLFIFIPLCATFMARGFH